MIRLSTGVKSVEWLTAGMCLVDPATVRYPIVPYVMLIDYISEAMCMHAGVCVHVCVRVCEYMYMHVCMHAQLQNNF